jgi:L-2-hydroxyglutarate oxidase
MMTGTNENPFDYIVIGGGILGLATAWQLIQRQPGSTVLLMEKESAVARHQTGRNSGVIHAGVYYQPGSLKAEFCRSGAAATYRFCEQYGVRHDRCGKLLVATSPLELERMRTLFKRCGENGLSPRMISADELKELEPNIEGQGAFLVDESGIVDYPAMCRQMAELFISAGGTIALNTELQGITEFNNEVRLATSQREYRGKFLIACAGLMADRVARMQAIKLDFRIIPFRGEYYCLRPEHDRIVSHLIYPIPDPALPFLGVHLTRMINGSVTVGPSALLGWKREGYAGLNFNLRDALEMLSYPGFWRLSRNHLASAVREIRNAISTNAYLDMVHRYCPSLVSDDLLPWPAGVRAMAVTRDGRMIDDFKFERSARSLHVCNAPSPAATSAIPIAKYICDQVPSVT